MAIHTPVNARNGAEKDAVAVALLAPCPFCTWTGSVLLGLGGGIQCIQCTRCGAQGPWGRGREEAHLAWNLAPKVRHLFTCRWTPFLAWPSTPPQVAVMPCPFCHDSTAWIHELGPAMLIVVCQVCKAQGPWERTHEEAWLAWQTAWTPTRLWTFCPVCQRRFTRRRASQVYDTPRCRIRAANARQHQQRGEECV